MPSIFLEKAKQALARVQHELTSGNFLAERETDGFLAVDGNGVIITFNRVLADMFGYSVDELAGLEVETLVPDEFRGRHQQHREAYNVSPHIRSLGLEVTGKHKTGTTFPASVMLFPLETGRKEDRLTAAFVRKKAGEERP